jgi:hypothetical protein
MCGWVGVCACAGRLQFERLTDGAHVQTDSCLLGEGEPTLDAASQDAACKRNNKGAQVVPTPNGVWHKDSHYRS